MSLSILPTNSALDENDCGLFYLKKGLCVTYIFIVAHRSRITFKTLRFSATLLKIINDANTKHSELHTSMSYGSLG